MAAQLKFTVEQGATWKHSLLLKTGGESGPAMDLTGYTAKMQARTSANADLVLLEMSTANGLIVITPLEGKLAFTIPAATTADLLFTNAVCDLLLTSGGGEVTRLFEGTITTTVGVTK